MNNPTGRRVTLDVAKLQDVASKPRIQRTEKLSDSTGRIWVDYAGLPGNLPRDFSLLTNGRIGVVPGTVREVAGSTGRLSFVAQVNSRSMPYTDEVIKTHELALMSKADTFIDRSADIWDLRGEGDMRRLFCRDAETLEQAMAKHPRSQTDSRVYADEYAHLDTGDYVSYVDNAGNLHFGTFLDSKDGKAVVLNRKTPAKPVEVARFAILDQIAHGALESEIQLNGEFAAGGKGLEQLTTYLRRIYANFPDYWPKWEAKIKAANAKFNPDASPVDAGI